MGDISDRDIHLERGALTGRTFILGNKRALALSLPAATGPSATLAHPHKWFGAYMYGRKFVEGQIVHAADGQMLCVRNQTGFTMALSWVRREYLVGGEACSETYFVPDGIDGFACELAGSGLHVEPEVDLRFYRNLNASTDGYELEELEDGIVVSHDLPSGRYDDLTETFEPDPATGIEHKLFLAIRVTGELSTVHANPAKQWRRRKIFRKDQQRERLVAHSAFDGEPGDHAPLWNRSASVVCVPARFSLPCGGVVVYGMGSSREEALAQTDAIIAGLPALEECKQTQARSIVDHARFECGDERVDTAYAQVLSRLMDALVARGARASDTALEMPATMILAGNQYFHDSWKRDENIALGFLLVLGFYDLARDVIADTWRLQDEVTGRLPQRIRAGEEPPYHSSDGTLWALLRLEQYRRCSGDESLLGEKLPLVVKFFERSLDRTVNGLLPSGRTVHDEYLWETWMDTPHTPRDGFPIEIQMLWLACLRAYRPVVAMISAELEGRMERAETEAWDELRRIHVDGIPADGLDRERRVQTLLTPNPYFCFGVDLDLGHEVEARMRLAGREQLAGRQGIVTLAPRDWDRVFPPEFLNDRRHVRGRRMRSAGKFNYHRGVEWNWLAHFFVLAELKYGNPDAAYRTYLRNQVSSALERAGIGGIGELFDLDGARGPDFQAWSMSGFLEALHAFAGVRIDVPGRRITIAPQVPRGWNGLCLRKWYGAVPFDVTYAGDLRRRTLQINFPEGEAEAEIEVALWLPAGREPRHVDLRLDGCPHMPAWCCEEVPGTDARRVRFSIPARRDIALELATKRAVTRTRQSA